MDSRIIISFSAFLSILSCPMLPIFKFGIVSREHYMADIR